eukprot:CAMPEP_0197042364 /NCGR_PEP_ID=MMETSP1384-20130603/18757_1 /TAXON_ID=29189 /ORGANISM="Ammonia sp." /LENGTH=431 /DNA_ID=CAMNT_0042473457 /DNA_START=20 /DNA_END=1315 /DNA_ORIENTATION=-
MANQWNIIPSANSMRASNPLRDIVEQLDMKSLPKDKKFISVAIGDPVAFPNFKTHPVITKAVTKANESVRRNAYMHTSGYKKARIALAKKYNELCLSGIDTKFKYSFEDVLITVGCVGAINLAFMTLLNPGDNILLPRPGFSYYRTVCEAYDFEPRFYNLLPDKNWAIDINHLESLIDDKTKAIFLNNPSNPCGNVLSKNNLLHVIDLAEKYKLPIIADEIYGEMVFAGNKFYSVTTLCAEYNMRVPVLMLSGMAKYWLVPGWKVGWMCIHDPFNLLKQARIGLNHLATLAISPASIIQVALPEIIENTPVSFHNSIVNRLTEQASLFYEGVREIAQLAALKPQAAMYTMVKINLDEFHPASGITDCVSFANKLLKDQALLVLPGVIFGMPNYFRVVLCPPANVIKEITSRLAEFCRKYARDSSYRPSAKL